MKLATFPCWEFSRIVILCYGCPLSDFRDIFNCPYFISASLLLGFSLEPTNLNIGQANLLLPQYISNLLQHSHLPQTRNSLKQYTVLLSVWSSSFVCFRIFTRLQSGGSARPGVSSGVQVGKEAHVVIGRVPFPKDFQVPAGYCLEMTFSFLPLRHLPQGNFLYQSQRQEAS